MGVASSGAEVSCWREGSGGGDGEGDDEVVEEESVEASVLPGQRVGHGHSTSTEGAELT